MFDREKILEKCRKILAIQDCKSATPAEAANAAALLKRMLEKYQLSMADVEAGLRSDGIIEVEIMRVKRLFQWQKNVHLCLSGAFDCRMLYQFQRDGVSVAYVGCASDVVVAEYFSKYFREALRPLWVVYKNRHGGSIKQKGSFWFAAAQVVSRRLEAMRPQKPEGPDTGERGLVVVKDALLKAWEQEQGVKEVRGRDMDFDHDAYLSGLQAGSNLPLNHGIPEKGAVA